MEIKNGPPGIELLKSAGWTITRNRSLISARSPVGTVVTYHRTDDVYSCGVSSDKDFKKLAKKVISTLADAVHMYRTKLHETRMQIKEIGEIVDTDNERSSTMLNNWVMSTTGVCSLDWDFGPLSVSATISPDNEWTVNMSDGGPCDKTVSGTSETLNQAQLCVMMQLIDWSAEVSETGRYAHRLMMRLKDITE